MSVGFVVVELYDEGSLRADTVSYDLSITHLLSPIFEQNTRTGFDTVPALTLLFRLDFESSHCI